MALPRMKMDTDEHEETLHYIVADGEADLEEAPAKFGGHLDAIFVATDRTEGRIRDHEEDGTKYGTLYTIRFNHEGATNRYIVPAVMLHFLNDLPETSVEDEAPASLVTPTGLQCLCQS